MNDDVMLRWALDTKSKFGSEQESSQSVTASTF